MGATIGVLHPGEMGAALVAQARRKGASVLWCPSGRSQATHDRATRTGLTPVSDLHELLDRAEVVVSICSSTAAVHVATQVALEGYKGVYVEANATSPQRCIRVAQRLTHSGAEVVDAAVFGTPTPDRAAKIVLYLAGRSSDIETVALLFEGTAVEPVRLDGGIGTASALQMAYAGYQKTAAVMAAVAHALAARYGVTAPLVAEARRAPPPPLADPNQLRGAAARAWSWTPELHELADALEDEELPRDLALAAAAISFRWHEDRDNPRLPLETVLAQLADLT